jgi:hypothetical protein
MNDDPTAVDVMYMKVKPLEEKDDRLMKLCGSL